MRLFYLWECVLQDCSGYFELFKVDYCRQSSVVDFFSGELVKSYTHGRGNAEVDNCY